MTRAADPAARLRGSGRGAADRRVWPSPRTASAAAVRRPARPSRCWPCSPRPSAALAATIARAADARVLLGLLAAGQLARSPDARRRRTRPSPRADVARAGHAGRARAGGRGRGGPHRGGRPALPRGVAGRPGRRRVPSCAPVATSRSSSPRTPTSRCVLPFSSPLRCRIGVRRSVAPADQLILRHKKATIECVSSPGRPSAPSSPLPPPAAALSIGLLSGAGAGVGPRPRRRRRRRARRHVGGHLPSSR